MPRKLICRGCRRLLILELHERNTQWLLINSHDQNIRRLLSFNSSKIVIINPHYSWPRHDSSCQCLQDYTSANTTDNITNYSTTLLIEVKKIPIKWQIMKTPFKLCSHYYLTSWYVDCWTLRIIKSVHRSQAEHG